MKKTLVDYWRLIWQERPSVIVMVTNLVEGGKNKCEQYWPTDETTDKQVGPFTVHLIEQQVFSHFVKRDISVTVCPIHYSTSCIMYHSLMMAITH